MRIANDLGIRGTLTLLEGAFPDEFERERSFLETLTIGEDDLFCEGQRFLGDSIDLFARVTGSTRDAAERELTSVFASEPTLLADLGPRRLSPPLILDPMAPFPLDALPAVIRDACAELSNRHGVLPELLGLMAMGAVSASIGKALTMPSCKGMFVMGNLYLAAGTPTGYGKSVLARYLFGPLHEHQGELLRAHSAKTAGIRAELQKVDAALVRSRANESVDGTLDPESANLAARKTVLERALIPPRFIVEDVTVEVLALRLSENNEFLANISADAKSAIMNLGGRYRKGAMEDDIYLKAFSGDAFYQDRITRGPVHLAEPRLVITWLTQHAFFDNVFQNQQLEDSGFACRFIALRVEDQQ
jgi:hypothetical protein